MKFKMKLSVEFIHIAHTKCQNRLTKLGSEVSSEHVVGAVLQLSWPQGKFEVNFGFQNIVSKYSRSKMNIPGLCEDAYFRPHSHTYATCCNCCFHPPRCQKVLVLKIQNCNTNHFKSYWTVKLMFSNVCDVNDQ